MHLFLFSNKFLISGDNDHISNFEPPGFLGFTDLGFLDFYSPGFWVSQILSFPDFEFPGFWVSDKQ